MKIYMREVGFGEAICLEENGHKLIIDCGSRSKGQGVTAADNTSDLLQSQNMEALVTHFDADHYNGFTVLAKQNSDTPIFNVIYLPKIFEDDGTLSWVADAVQDAVKVWAYDAASTKSNKLGHLTKFFCSLPGLVDNRARVKYISKGDTVSLSRKEFQVLWPDLLADKNIIKYAPSLKAFLQETLPKETFEEIQDAVEEYLKVFMEIYRQYHLHADESQYNLKDEAQYNLEDELEKAYKKLKSIVLIKPLEKKIRNRIFKLSNGAIHNMNDCSIVLECQNDVLMLGDVGPTAYDRYIHGELSSDHFKAVKVAHHGTKNYYTALLPETRIYLISNNVSNNSDGIYKSKCGIFKEYPNYYGNKVRCTNKNIENCQYRKDTGPCCTDCNVDRQYSELYYDLDTL